MNNIIYPLKEGVFTVGKDKIFVPFHEETDMLEERPTGSLLVEIQPFLLKLNNDIILLDTGLGNSNANGELQLHTLIKNAGVHPSEVTKVLLSHLHKDHAGGIGYTDSNGNETLTFPNAIYYIYQKEFDYATENKTNSYIPHEFEFLRTNQQVEWLDGTHGTIDEYISYEHSGGHSPYHIVYKIITPEGIIFFGGDEAPQLKQLKIKVKTKYDFDGQKSMELREQYAKIASVEDWTFLFYHDVKIPFSKL